MKDSNLLWLRYLNTLVSGSHGAAPMRTAMMEFTDYAGWTKFESTNMERTHILYVSCSPVFAYGMSSANVCQQFAFSDTISSGSTGSGFYGRTTLL